VIAPSAAGNLKTVRRLQKGDILLEVSSAVPSRCISNLNNLVGCPILVTPHRSLNTSKGVIRCKELLNCDKEEILSELQKQYVRHIKYLSKGRLWQSTQYQHFYSHFQSAYNTKTSQNWFYPCSRFNFRSEPAAVFQVPEVWPWQ